MISNHELQALAGRRFEAVGRGDLDGVMSGLVDEPRFDLYPVGLRLSGQENVRRHYDHFFRHVAPAIVASDHLATFFADDAIGFEFRISWQPETGAIQSSRMLVIMPVEGDRFTGERVYGEERLFRWMFGGPIWPILKPITA